MKKILFWGRFDENYSRYRIVAKLLENLNFKIYKYKPKISKIGFITAHFNKITKPNAIWIPCFRHKDILSATHFAKKWNVPLIIDPLISAYGKKVFERKKFKENSYKAKKLLRWERKIFSKANIVIADTDKHLEFFEKTLLVSREKLFTLFVGAEENLFYPMENKKKYRVFEILFYGSFLKLHGLETITQAIKMSQNIKNIKWTLLGDGKLKKQIAKETEHLPNVNLEDWISYEKLPHRIAKADILLGVFGDSFQAKLVIPNKVFQAMAMAKPIITIKVPSYPQKVLDSNVIGWTNPASPKEIVEIISDWTKDEEKLKERGKKTKKIFSEFFSYENLTKQLQTILKKVNL